MVKVIELKNEMNGARERHSGEMVGFGGKFRMLETTLQDLHTVQKLLLKSFEEIKCNGLICLL
jgi:hypothetical protein